MDTSINLCTGADVPNPTPLAQLAAKRPVTTIDPLEELKSFCLTNLPIGDTEVFLKHFHDAFSKAEEKVDDAPLPKKPKRERNLGRGKHVPLAQGDHTGGSRG